MALPRGYSLTELAVALALAGFVVGAGVRVLVGAQRAVRSIVERAADAQRHREVLGLFRTELAAVDPGTGDLVGVWADSLTYRAVRSLLASCRPPLVEGAVLEVVIAAQGRGVRPWRPGRDGLMMLWPDSGRHVWRNVQVHSVREGARCADGGPGVSLELAPPTGGSAPRSTLFRAYEFVTITSYRGSDGLWWIGATVKGIAGAGQIQPFAGPVRPRGIGFAAGVKAVTVAIEGSGLGPSSAALAPGVGHE